MSKVEAALHGSKVEDRLRRVAPFGDDEALLVEAANTITELRAQLAGTQRMRNYYLRLYKGVTDIYGRSYDA